MKCIKNLETGEITRVDDDKADRLTKNRDAFWFAPKSEWRAQEKALKDQIESARATHQAEKNKNKKKDVVKKSGK
jgi:hypothetical protein